MRKTKKTIAILAIVAMVFTMIPMQVFAADATTYSRIAGYDQYETAAAIAKASYASADTALIAVGTRGNSYDALAAAPLAAKKGAPLLLTEGHKLPNATKDALKALGVKNVIIIGGPGVIKQAVEDAIKGLGISVTRVYGYDAAETSVAIAKQMGSFNTVVLAGGKGQDALSISPIAAANGWPILYTNYRDHLPESVANYVATLSGVSTTYVIGGIGVIYDIQALQMPGTKVRVYGYDAYDTNLAVIEKFADMLRFNKVYVANGETMVDALAGAPLAAKNYAPIVLTNNAKVTAADFVSKQLYPTSEVVALGGTAAVSDSMLKKIAYVEPTKPQQPETPADPAIKSVTVAEDAKSVTVAFDKEVDTTKAAFEVKSGDTKVTATVKFADDKKSATLTFEKALAAGEYTVTVTGVAKEALSGKFTVAAPAKLEVEVSAVGAKVLQLTFNAPVDTEKASIEVKKGTVKVNVDTVKWNDDKTVATVTLSGKITAGEYTATVKGLTDEALTASVKTENETIASVEIRATEAPIIVTTSGSTTTRSVKVPYALLNQYGEDVTKTLGSVTVTASGAGIGTASVATAGTVTVPLDTTAADIGSKFVLTVVETTAGKSDSETITIVAAAAPNSFEFVGVYNKDGKALNDKSVPGTDEYYILVDVKDQYGNVLDATALNAANIVLNNVDSNVATVDSSSVNSLVVAKFYTVDVKGTDKTGLKITDVKKAGKTTIMLVSGATGANASYVLEVAETQRVNTLQFETPELFVADETTFVPLVAYDQEGQQITDLSILSDSNRGVAINYGSTPLTITKDKNGVTGVNVTVASGVTSVTLTATIKATNQPVVKTFTVSPDAKPVRVGGLTSTATTALLKTGARTDTQAISTTTVVVYDQYERQLSAAKKSSLFAPGTGKYELVVTEEDASGSAISVTGGSNSYTVTALAKGTEKVTIAIKDLSNGSIVSGSEKVVTFRTTDGTEYVSYQLKDIGLVPDNSIHKLNAGSENLTTGAATPTAYEQTVVVYGVLSDGGKVKLDAADYIVEFSDTDVSTDSIGRIVVASPANPNDDPLIDYDANKDGKVTSTEVTAVVSMKVTIKATGTQLTKDVTISREGSKAVKVVAIEDGAYTVSGGTVPEDRTIVSSSDAAKLTALTSYTATGPSVTVSNVADFLVTDQYGVITFYKGDSSDFTYLATPAVPYSVTIENQLAHNLTISSLDAGDEVTITAVFGDASVTFKVRR